ncbi:MAG: GNAT family N-acetyltransferase [Clostridiales bacterium]|nr:GNAT family N-acetyltransferase [Clostridiales bacterium]
MIVIDRCTNIDLLMKWRMEVLHCVFSIPDDADTSELEMENRRYYEQNIAGEGHIACVAYEDGEAAGCGSICLYDEMPSPDNPSGRCAYLMNIYVREPFRGHGIGRSIVDWLVDRARERGITKIYLETTPGARRLYRETGFNDMEDMMIWKHLRKH